MNFNYYNIPKFILNLKRGVYILPFFLFFPYTLSSQWLYVIDGIVNTKGKKLEGAMVTLYKGSAQTQQIITSSNGKFHLNLDQEQDYTLNITKDGFIAKKLFFSTKGVPKDIASNFEAGAKPEVDIFELPKDPEIASQVTTILAQPVAKFLYDPTQQDIVFDKAYSESMLQELNRLNQLEKEARKKEQEEAKNQMASAAATESKYKQVITKADAAFNKKDYPTAKAGYQEALAIKKGEAYPVNKLMEIDKLIADANKNAQQEADYNAAINRGDKAFAAKTLDIAKSNYTEALALKPSEKYPKTKIAEIEKLLNSTADLENKYKALLTKADMALRTKDYNSAKNNYTEASNIKPSEAYPKEKILEIEKILSAQAAKNAADKEKMAKEKELTAAYTTIIAKADKAFSDKDYVSAKTAYNEAYSLKKTEQYPKDKISEIEKIMAQLAAKEAADKERNTELINKYNAAIAAGDKAFGTKDYASAKKYYSDALVLKTTEKYPKEKISEIEKLLTNAEEQENKYKAAIAKADAAFNNKGYDNAKKIYNEALSYKPNEVYPKDKLAEIDHILAKEAGIKELEANYKAAITKGDKAFGSKDYTTAQTAYIQAASFKPDEAYPKTRLTEINNLLASIAAKEKADKERLAGEKALNDKYIAAISKADGLFTSKNYEASKEAYRAALALKPSEKYPKERLSAIDELLNAIVKEQEEKYKAAIVKADAAFAAKNYTLAKSAYEEAKVIQPSQNYPKEQLSKIDLLLAGIEKEKELKEKYQAAINRADGFTKSKQYQDALAAYKEAITIKPSETYPHTKITEINKLIDEEERNKEKNKQYADIILKADKAFSSKDYKQAKSIYADAAILKPTEKYPKQKLTEIDNILNPKTVITNAASEKAKDDFRNELAKKYPQGITEESGKEGNLQVIRRIVVKGEEAHLYLKKITTFGAIYYFKDEVSITEAEFNRDTNPSKK